MVPRLLLLGEVRGKNLVQTFLQMTRLMSSSSCLDRKSARADGWDRFFCEWTFFFFSFFALKASENFCPTHASNWRRAKTRFAVMGEFASDVGEGKEGDPHPHQPVEHLSLSPTPVRHAHMHARMHACVCAMHDSSSSREIILFVGLQEGDTSINAKC